jgi:hypothetical protein
MLLYVNSKYFAAQKSSKTRVKVNITKKNYARAAACVEETARRRLHATPFHGGAYGERLYNLGDAAVTMRPREVNGGAVERLAAYAAAPAGVQFVGADKLDTAQRLIAFLPAEMATRYQDIRRMFFVAVANSNICAGPIVENIGHLSDLFILQPDILVHVLGAAPRPDVHSIAPAFSLVNNSNAFKQAA